MKKLKCTSVGYVIRKMLVFGVLYVLATILQQVLLIGSFFLMGYQPMEGNLPAETVQTIAMYYGFVVFALSAIVYCKCVEKRSVQSMGLNRHVVDYLLGALLACVLLVVILGICYGAGGISLRDGVFLRGGSVWLYLLALLGGFIVQGFAEEVMCRGFLMTSLMKKVSVPVAVFLSASAFAFPHFTNLFLSEGRYAFVGIVNLYLISAIFSFLMLWRGNIWVSCGLHSIWNFVLNGILGLSVSGNEADVSGIICFYAGESSIINGGSYGIESSIVTTLILGVAAVGIYQFWKKDRRNEHGF